MIGKNSEALGSLCSQQAKECAGFPCSALLLIK